jgi:hypothetical protein
MTFPFTITQEIRDAYDDHQAYCSAGQAWLIRNDPDGYNEQELIEAIHDLLIEAAQEYFGDDEDSYEEFYEECFTDTSVWWEMLEEELEAAE